jgi:hypothetical protein
MKIPNLGLWANTVAVFKVIFYQNHYYRLTATFKNETWIWSFTEFNGFQHKFTRVYRRKLSLILGIFCLTKLNFTVVR